MPKKKNKTKVPTESLKNVEEQSIVTENVTALESKVEEPVLEEPKVKEPVLEEPKVEEPKVEEPKVKEEPKVEEPVLEGPKVEEPVLEEPVLEEPVLEEPSVKSDNLCSLKTIISVLGKWSNSEIRRGRVETLLKEGTEVDENLDNVEKTVEVLKLWIKEGGSIFKSHDKFLDMGGYTLVGKSKNLSEEKKVEALKTLTELIINVSNRRISDEERDTVLNNL